MKYLPINSLLNKADGIPIIDVRSPGEFTKGHIPGAINLPVFTDQERARVGTVYKQKSKDEAISLGLEIVGPKMKSIADTAKEYAINNSLKVYCWRGGMRSKKMAWLFDLVGIQTLIIKGGYKAYRNYIHEKFNDIEHLIVIQGPTGSGKTQLLHTLMDKGEQVIDLEGLAHHKGSAFGALGEPDQPTTEQFQNRLANVVSEFNLNKPIWIESESMSIGRVYLPENLWKRMNDSTLVSIKVPREMRIENIIKEYGGFSIELLVSRIEHLKQKLGGEKMQRIIDYVNNGKLYKAVDILLNYYDKSYDHSAMKYKLSKPITLQLDTDNLAINAQKLIDSILVAS